MALSCSFCSLLRPSIIDPMSEVNMSAAEIAVHRTNRPRRQRLLNLRRVVPISVAFGITGLAWVVLDFWWSRTILFAHCSWLLRAIDNFHSINGTWHLSLRKISKSPAHPFIAGPFQICSASRRTLWIPARTKGVVHSIQTKRKRRYGRLVNPLH